MMVLRLGGLGQGLHVLSIKERAKNLQSKYPKRWRFNENILSRVKAFHRKSRNIVTNWCWKFSKQIVLKNFKAWVCNCFRES
jgi:hypothetical protein